MPKTKSEAAASAVKEDDLFSIDLSSDDDDSVFGSASAAKKLINNSDLFGRVDSSSDDEDDDSSVFENANGKRTRRGRGGGGDDDDDDGDSGICKLDDFDKLNDSSSGSGSGSSNGNGNGNGSGTDATSPFSSSSGSDSSDDDDDGDISDEENGGGRAAGRKRAGSRGGGKSGKGGSGKVNGTRGKHVTKAKKTVKKVTTSSEKRRADMRAARLEHSNKPMLISRRFSYNRTRTSPFVSPIHAIRLSFSPKKKIKVVVSNEKDENAPSKGRTRGGATTKTRVTRRSRTKRPVNYKD